MMRLKDRLQNILKQLINLPWNQAQRNHQSLHPQEEYPVLLSLEVALSPSLAPATLVDGGQVPSKEEQELSYHPPP